MASAGCSARALPLHTRKTVKAAATQIASRRSSTAAAGIHHKMLPASRTLTSETMCTAVEAAGAVAHVRHGDWFRDGRGLVDK